jgi:hypothetical protein
VATVHAKHAPKVPHSHPTPTHTHQNGQIRTPRRSNAPQNRHARTRTPHPRQLKKMRTHGSKPGKKTAPATSNHRPSGGRYAKKPHTRQKRSQKARTFDRETECAKKNQKRVKKNSCHKKRRWFALGNGVGMEGKNTWRGGTQRFGRGWGWWPAFTADTHTKTAKSEPHVGPTPPKTGTHAHAHPTPVN